MAIIRTLWRSLHSRPIILGIAILVITSARPLIFPIDFNCTSNSTKCYMLSYLEKFTARARILKASNQFDAKKNYSMGSDRDEIWLRQKYISNETAETIKTCIVPKLSLATDANKNAFPPAKPLKCEGQQLFYTENGAVRFNKTLTADKSLAHCEYQGILWATDDSLKYTEKIKREFPFQFDIKHDFFVIRCYNKTDMTHEQFFAEIVEKDQIVNSGNKTSVISGYNVLMFGFDSMSRLGYERKLPNLFRYLKETLNAFILNAYNIVGDGTAAALMPILAGKPDTQFSDGRNRIRESVNVDTYPLIWYEFKRHGYATMYAEDHYILNTFNLRYKGFEAVPTDHYMRPFWHAVDKSKLAKRSKKHCVRGIPKHIYTRNYTRKFMQSYKRIPKFAFAFNVELSHNNNVPVEYADQDTVDMLEDLRLAGILNDTFLIIMADHGPRYGRARGTAQGKLEERLPMMALIPPPRFRKEHRDNIRHLTDNLNKISSPFDIHETLLDILKPERLDVKQHTNTKGLSLLREIPLNRTCDSAGILPHWCTCLNRMKISPDDPVVVKVGGAIVDHMNSLVKNHTDICNHLTLKEVKEAATIVQDEKVVHNNIQFGKNVVVDANLPKLPKSHLIDIKIYQLQFVTAPSNGLYETTVEHHLRSDTFVVGPDISRINAYGNQANCVLYKLPHLRKYCHCKAK